MMINVILDMNLIQVKTIIRLINGENKIPIIMMRKKLI